MKRFRRSLAILVMVLSTQSYGCIYYSLSHYYDATEQGGAQLQAAALLCTVACCFPALELGNLFHQHLYNPTKRPQIFRVDPGAMQVISRRNQQVQKEELIITLKLTKVFDPETMTEFDAGTVHVPWLQNFKDQEFLKTFFTVMSGFLTDLSAGPGGPLPFSPYRLPVTDRALTPDFADANNDS